MNSSAVLMQPVISLNGIGGQTVARLNQLRPGTTALICARVISSGLSTQGRQTLACQISDETGYLSLRFFHFNAKQLNSLSAGTLISCFGEVKAAYSGYEMIHPEYKIIRTMNDCITSDTLTAIYPLTEGLHQAVIRKAINQALSLYNQHPESLPELLPASVLQQFNYPDLRSALNTLHTPSSGLSVEALLNHPNPALKRLAFEEFIAHQLSQVQKKLSDKQWQAPQLKCTKIQAQQFIDALPFALTHAQQRVINEIQSDKVMLALEKPWFPLMQHYLH